MKRFPLLALLIAVSAAAWAQDARTICGRYVTSEGVKVVSVSPTKFAGTRALPLIAMGEGRLDLAPLVTAFRSYYLLTSTNADVNKLLDADVASLIQDGGYELLLMSGETGAMTGMYAVATEDSVSSLLLCSMGGDVTSLLALDADLSRADLKAATDKVLPQEELPVVDEAHAEAHSIAPSDDATSATSYSKVSDLDAANYTDIYAYIRSKVSGTNRGPSSINSGTDAIYVVDGIQVPNIDGMSPMDIYSVEYVKDSSAAIYGFRGVNGVFNIVTKAAHMQKEAEAEARRAAKEARRAAREAKRK